MLQNNTPNIPITSTNISVFLRVNNDNKYPDNIVPSTAPIGNIVEHKDTITSESILRA
jgi:hypothetical protein